MDRNTVPGTATKNDRIDTAYSILESVEYDKDMALKIIDDEINSLIISESIGNEIKEEIKEAVFQIGE